MKSFSMLTEIFTLGKTSGSKKTFFLLLIFLGWVRLSFPNKLKLSDFLSSLQYYCEPISKQNFAVPE